MPVIDCPICGFISAQLAFTDNQAGEWVEEVYIPAMNEPDCTHEITISYGCSVVESVRDENGDEIPQREWRD